MSERVTDFLTFQNNLLEEDCVDPVCVIPLTVKRLINAKGELKAQSRSGAELKLGKWDDSVSRFNKGNNRLEY